MERPVDWAVQRALRLIKDSLSSPPCRGVPLSGPRSIGRLPVRRSCLKARAHFAGDELGHLDLFVASASSAIFLLADDPAGATAAAAETVAQKNSGGLGFLADAFELFLKSLDGALEGMHVPYSYGFAIILLTFLVKARRRRREQRKACGGVERGGAVDAARVARLTPARLPPCSLCRSGHIP